MKVVVTGDKGFLGSRLSRRLEKAHSVYGLNRTVGDISNFKVVYDFISAHRPDVVVHCAAIGDIPTCEANKELAYKSNYIATKNIASACADFGSRMIYISSDQVYNYYTDEPITELTPVNPTNYYGLLKAEAEKDVQAIVPRSHIVRIAWQFDMPAKEDSRGGLVELIGKALQNNIPVYSNPNSHQYMCYVQDTIEVLTKMAEQTVPYGIYNVAEETDKTLSEVFAYAMKSLGADDETVERLVLPREDWKVKNLCAKAYNLEMCGYKMPTFEEALARCLSDRA